MDAFVDKARALLRIRILRVAFFGVFGVIAQTAFFELFSIYLQVLRPSLGTLFGAELGIITTFILNNKYSFRDRQHAPLPARLLRYHLTVSGSLFIQWLFVFIAESHTTNFWIIHVVYFGSILVGFVFNYTGYRLWVWRNHTPPEL